MSVVLLDNMVVSVLCLSYLRHCPIKSRNSSSNDNNIKIAYKRIVYLVYPNQIIMRCITYNDFNKNINLISSV